MKRKAKTSSQTSNSDVLKAISDHLCMDIITAIFNRVTKPDDLERILDISHKQYYSRSCRLTRLGLISRKNGEMILTSFGKVVYNAMLKIANAFSHSSELTMIDAIRSHAEMPEVEQKKISIKSLRIPNSKCWLLFPRSLILIN
ncbi:MAG: hypothetical protein ACHQXG_02300 [Nitrososphaerales archaeon]